MNHNKPIVFCCNPAYCKCHQFHTYAMQHLPRWLRYWATFLGVSNQQQPASLKHQPSQWKTPTEAKTETNFFILLSQVIAWLPCCIFQFCLARAKGERKDRRWAGMCNSYPSHQRFPSIDCTILIQLGYIAKAQKDDNELICYLPSPSP